MENSRKAVLGAVATASLLASGVAPAFADTPEAQDQNGIVAVEESTQAGSGYVAADAQEGVFAWDQTTITPNSVIKNLFRPATNALCQATESFAMANPLEWKLSVSGDVADAFTATVDELAQEQAVKQTMTCSCGGNPSDGAAIITADVKGVPVTHLFERAGVEQGVNTVTFIAADGTEVVLPYGYVVGHHAVISFEINDEDLSASVGGNNQLWMTKASANYFLRDVVEIRVTKEAEAPANPGEGIEYPNSPNAGFLPN